MELQGLQNSLSYVKAIKDTNESKIDSMREYLEDKEVCPNIKEYISVEMAKASEVVKIMDKVLYYITMQTSEIIDKEHSLNDKKMDLLGEFLFEITNG